MRNLQGQREQENQERARRDVREGRGREGAVHSAECDGEMSLETTGNPGRIITTSLRRQSWSRSRPVHAHNICDRTSITQQQYFEFKWCKVMNSDPIVNTSSRTTQIYLTPSRFQSLYQVVPAWEKPGGQLSCHAARCGKRLWGSHQADAAPPHPPWGHLPAMGLTLS